MIATATMSMVLPTSSIVPPNVTVVAVALTNLLGAPVVVGCGDGLKLDCDHLADGDEAVGTR